MSGSSRIPAEINHGETRKSVGINMQAGEEEEFELQKEENLPNFLRKILLLGRNVKTKRIKLCRIRSLSLKMSPHPMSELSFH